MRHGDKRGRELGFPTANLSLDAACGLRHGVYAVRVGLAGRRYDGVANFGRRPMFDSGVVLLEVFLFDFAGDLYGRRIDVAFIEWIRDEAAFGSVDELVRAMNDDAAKARRRSNAPAMFSANLSKELARVVGFCSPRSRSHCAARKASSATGMMRCQPSVRPAWRAAPRIFGSSSHDDAPCARAARSRIARCLARRREIAATALRSARPK